ncbi:hypothetical protein [Bacillus cytotoxicus]|uniref:hypothetical protein n=1 Tax=Bacillus cytotoxicus TaxID=580165 RepID=UPI003B782277
MLFDDVQAPTKPYCDICGSEIDNIDIYETYIPEKEITACSECCGNPTTRILDRNTLFDLTKELGKHFGHMSHLRDVQRKIEEQHFFVEIDIKKKVEGELLRQPTGEKISFSTEELLIIFDRLKMKLAGHTTISRAVALISERDITVTIRKENP